MEEPDSLVAARWLRRHRVPPLPADALDALRQCSEVLLRAIHEAPASPPREIRVCYQAMKYLLRTAEEPDWGAAPHPSRGRRS